MALPARVLVAQAPVDWPQFYDAVHWIQAVMAALSIIGSSSVIGYTVFQHTARSPEVRPLFYLSLSDLFLGICWLIGALLYRKEAPDPSSQGAACYNLQITGEVFYVASFLYTINYTWHLYADLKVKYEQNLQNRPLRAFNYPNRIGRITIILSSVIPLLLMAPVFGLGNHYRCYQNFTKEHGCLLMHTNISSLPDWQLRICSPVSYYSTGAFLLSFLSSFTVILVLLIRARTLYKRFVSSTGYMGDQQWATIKVVEQGVVLYPVVFFCCWGPAFILGIVKLASAQKTWGYMTLCVLEALTAPSQGFLNCAVYGWTQHMFRCLKREAYREVDTQTPLLRSQKRLYASTLPPSHRADFATATSPSL
uniref:Transmembrane protein 116 n=1 Tax=Salvator merianae TaxID=96440 RepID=A0A8D0BYX0_SALMN